MGGGRGSGILGQKAKVLTAVPVAWISGKTSRTYEPYRPKPWPYKERGYTNLMAFWDGTTKRLWENSVMIAVEGMPGIGKTEVAKAIAEEFEMEYFPSATMDDMYINKYGFDQRKLDPKLPPHMRSYEELDFGRNPTDDRAVSMQFRLFLVKFFKYADAMAHLFNTGDGVVVEGTPYADLVFLETMYNMGYVNKMEREAYYAWRANNIVYLLRPHVVVFLDASPDVVYDNLKKRGRGEEKGFNKAFLEKLLENYKHHFLQTVEEHAEVLVYDWTVPGDKEVIVEDIERLSLEHYDEMDPKMSDWRMPEEWDFSEKRYWATDVNERARSYYRLVHHWFGVCPRLYNTPEDHKILYDVWETGPGNKYQPGYNPDMGDSVLWKSRGYFNFVPKKTVSS